MSTGAPSTTPRRMTDRRTPSCPSDSAGSGRLRRTGLADRAPSGRDARLVNLAGHRAVDFPSVTRLIGPLSTVVRYMTFVDPPTTILCAGETSPAGRPTARGRG